VLINGENVPFGPDYLQNYEIGWKTSWLDHTLRFNGAVSTTSGRISSSTSSDRTA